MAITPKLRRCNSPLTIAAFATVLAVCVGCGDAGTEAGEESSAPTREAFVAQGNAACQRERRNLVAEATELLEGQSESKPRPEVVGDLTRFVLMPTVERQVTRIEELIRDPGPPRGDRERVEAMRLEQQRAVDTVATTERVGSVEAVYREFGKAGRLYRSYGMAACANDPRAPHVDQLAALILRS